MGGFGQAKLWDLQLTSQMVGTQWSCADFVWMVGRKSPWRFPQWRGEDLLASRLRLLLDLIAKRALSFSERPHPAPETDEGGCRNFESPIRSLRQKQRAVMSNKDISRPPKKAPGDPSKRSLGFPRRCLQTLRGHLGSPNSTSRTPKRAFRATKRPLKGPQKAPTVPKAPITSHFWASHSPKQAQILQKPQNHRLWQHHIPRHKSTTLLPHFFILNQG